MSEPKKVKRKKVKPQPAMIGDLSIADPTDPRQRAPVNAVIYGAPGSGKTFLGATANAPLLIDLERGAMASAAATGNSKARVVEANSIDDIREIYAFLKKGNHEFDAVVIDPLSELMRISMTHVIESFPTAKRQYGDQPTMTDWGKMQKDVIALITAFRALPMNTVVLAHSDIPNHDEDVVQPLVSGKQVKPFIMGAMDLLGYLYIDSDEDEEPVRKLLTQATASIAAKNRGNLLPAVVEEPNLAEIFRIMEGREE